MKEKIEDRRIARTRGMLLEALIDLMIEKGYEEITVQDIIDRANVGRSTFYLHFTDKEELLVSNINQLREFLIEQSKSNSAQEIKGGFRFGISLAMLQHAQSHKRLYKAITCKKGGAMVLHYMNKMFNELIRDDIEDIFPSSSLIIPPNTIADFIVNTFNTVLTWWMSQNMPCSALEANQIFYKLAFSGLSGLK